MICLCAESYADTDSDTFMDWLLEKIPDPEEYVINGAKKELEKTGDKIVAASLELLAQSFPGLRLLGIGKAANNSTKEIIDANNKNTARILEAISIASIEQTNEVRRFFEVRDYKTIDALKLRIKIFLETNSLDAQRVQLNNLSSLLNEITVLRKLLEWHSIYDTGHEIDGQKGMEPFQSFHSYLALVALELKLTAKEKVLINESLLHTSPKKSLKNRELEETIKSAYQIIIKDAVDYIQRLDWRKAHKKRMVIDSFSRIQVDRGGAINFYIEETHIFNYHFDSNNYSLTYFDPGYTCIGGINCDEKDKATYLKSEPALKTKLDLVLISKFARIKQEIVKPFWEPYINYGSGSSTGHYRASAYLVWHNLIEYTRFMHSGYAPAREIIASWWKLSELPASPPITIGDKELDYVMGVSDTDLDGLPDLFEDYLFYTNPEDKDTDKDGVPDNKEEHVIYLNNKIGRPPIK